MIRSLFKNRIFYAFGLVALTGISFLVFSINAPKASADSCTPNGRDCYYGYFYNGYDGGAAANGTRWNVLSAPALLNVGNKFDLINWVGGYLGGCSNLNSQNQTGAAFIILHMLGAPPGTNKGDACARFGEWGNLVVELSDGGYANYDTIYDFNCLNTRSTLTDVAWYPSCGAASSIVFYSPVTGQPIYAIKKDCGNPVGQTQALFLNYNLQADIVSSVNGATGVAVAEAGDTINFSFRIINNGSTGSTTVNCDAHIVDHAGFYNNAGAPESGGAGIGTSCPRPFPRFSVSEVANQTVIAGANTTVCRTLFVDPSTPGGGRQGTEVCVPVASKPYLKVYGGDVSAGGGLETAPSTCATTGSQIISWNKRDAAYSGAGTQYGAYALNTINDFATAQGNGALAPTGLSFANTATNVPNGNFGGNFGSAKCIKDYFSQKPTSGVLPYSSLLANPQGVFESPSNVTLVPLGLPATINWIIYIDGDLQINNDVTYTGSWNVATMPYLQIIVRGNIYISDNVRNLYGTYIAQPTAAGTKGVIYTCANAFTVPVVNNGSFASGCTNKLTVNGSFVAKDVEFLRVRGTLRGSSADAGSGANNAAEEFNYGPAFWIGQPRANNSYDGRVQNYDSITSLPPIL